MSDQFYFVYQKQTLGDTDLDKELSANRQHQ